MRLRLSFTYNAHFIKILARAQLDYLSKTRLAREQEIDLLERPAGGFRVPEPHHDNGSPV